MSNTENTAISTIVNTVMAEAHDDSAIKDFERARANIHEMLETVNSAVTRLAEIADSSQLPRAYEVLAKLVDSGVSASQNLLILQEKIRKLNNIDDPTNARAKTVNNNLFVGSTAELQKLLKEMKDNE